RDADPAILLAGLLLDGKLGPQRVGRRTAPKRRRGAAQQRIAASAVEALLAVAGGQSAVADRDLQLVPPFLSYRARRVAKDVAGPDVAPGRLKEGRGILHVRHHPAAGGGGEGPQGLVRVLGVEASSRPQRAR